MKENSKQKGFQVKAVYVLCAVALAWIIYSSGSSSLSLSSPLNSPSLKGGFAATNSISGSVFEGKSFRSFAGERVFVDGWEKKVGKQALTWENIVSKHYTQKQGEEMKKTDCSEWSVVTTIFPPTEAIVDAANMKGWCIVVVGDNKTPDNWLASEPKLKGSDSIFFVSADEQRQWEKIPGELGAFVRAIPFNHFGRKNFGFIYAMIRGAKFIYDFDDDNYTNKDASGKTLALIPNKKEIENVRYLSTTEKDFNHHPLMGATLDNSWARGFPLELILDTKTHAKVKSTGNKVPMDKVGVIQYCADNNPDIDAIHRLTKPLPMNFASEDKSSPILVPKNVYAPYNAQATIHTAPAFFATLLPVHIPSRVTDIWRSYFAEALFRDMNLSVVFAPPRITQIRNVHSYIGDFDAESDLYYKSNKLTEFLHEWNSSSMTVPGRMEHLWIELYERGYVEEGDVKLAQLWLGALVQISYDFHSVNKS